MSNVEREKVEILKTAEDQLMSADARMSTAVLLTKQLLGDGSELEIASDYLSLKGVMESLNSTPPSSAVKPYKTIGEIRFTETKPSEDKLTLGYLTYIAFGRRRVVNRCTRTKKTSVLNLEFGNVGNKMLATAVNVAVTPQGDFAVANYGSADIKIYNATGVYKSSFNVNTGVDAGKASHPWCIQVGPNNLFFVTDYSSPYVKIFDLQGKYQRQFFTVSPGNVSYNDSSVLCGLAFNSKDEVLAGNVTHNFISRHALDGAHLSSINVAMRPQFLAVTSKDHIIVSSFTSSGEVQIIDETGNVLSKLQKPAGVTSLHPVGLVVSKSFKVNDDEDELFLADRNNGHAVYRYSSSGKYIDCVTKDVTNIYGLTLSTDEQRLIVADCSTVKCFDI